MSSASTQAVTFEDVVAASRRVEELAHQTPVETSRHFNEAAGVEAYFKCENLQRGGSFKIRGAANFIMSLSPAERARGVVTYSSGNHAQAVAIAAAHTGVQATIVMPTDAPKAKLASTQAYGPKIVHFDRQRENREEIAGRIADETGAVVLPSYDHPWIIAGQGTAALELLGDVPDLDAVFVCLGGGGLLSGTLIVTKAAQPNMSVYGVEPELANDWSLSLQRGERTGIPPPPTIADGLRTQIPGQITFPIVKQLSSGVVLVSEEEIKATMRFLLSRMKLLVEPSGAVAAAAVLHRKIPAGLKSVGVLLSGGNVDLDVLAGICAEGA
ncbi:MAG TPA: pyridoxal-phosphate dependent enzyme [Bryobacteraceae bacterium]|nr:pyridoxal-phosphate dependent enzyme [Bryobacteraceae bacterium]